MEGLVRPTKTKRAETIEDLLSQAREEKANYVLPKSPARPQNSRLGLLAMVRPSPWPWIATIEGVSYVDKLLVKHLQPCGRCQGLSFWAQLELSLAR
jgi:hypothetical protein